MISIITPVYNGEKYISRLIESILNQDFNDWELIIVNDGSTDKTETIITKYSKEDSRIRGYTTINQGVSAARQFGLEKSRGEYIIHADSDDFVDCNMLSELYCYLSTYDVDLLICDYYINTKNEQKIIFQKPTSLKPDIILKELFSHLHGSCCNKIVRKTIIDKYNIKFPQNLNYCEDLIFWIKILTISDLKIGYLNKAFYHYCEGENSITSGYSKGLFLNSCKVVKELYSIYPNNKYKDESINTFKLNIKSGAFKNFMFFSSSEYYSIYPEVNKYLLFRNKNYVYNIFLRLSYIRGFFFLSTRCYRILTLIKNKINAS